jgi:hypothetical protein
MGDFDRALDYSFAMASAAESFRHGHGRFPQSEGELLDSASLAGVTIDRDELKSLVVRSTRDGGVRIRWAERSRGGLLVSELSGGVDIPGDPESSSALATQATKPSG